MKLLDHPARLSSPAVWPPGTFVDVCCSCGCGVAEVLSRADEYTEYLIKYLSDGFIGHYNLSQSRLATDEQIAIAVANRITR